MDCWISLKCHREFDHLKADKVQTFRVKRSGSKGQMWQMWQMWITGLQRYKSVSDRLSDFKLGEYHPSAEINMSYMFKIGKTTWQVFNLYCEKAENVIWSPNRCSLSGNRYLWIWWRCQNFNRKLGNCSFCACAVKMWLEVISIDR